MTEGFVNARQLSSWCFHILLALICEPLRAWLIGGSNGNVDLNKLLRELALRLAGIGHFYIGRGHRVV